MQAPRNPSEIAREALKRLADRHLAPTPANFQACYNEIAQLPNVAPFPEPPLRQLADRLVPRGQEQSAALARLGKAIIGRSWHGVQESLLAFVAGASAGSVAGERLPTELSQALLHFCEPVLPGMVAADSRLEGPVNSLLALLRQPPCESAAVAAALRELNPQAMHGIEDQAEINHALLRLLHLLIENIGELVIEDRWLKGQVDGLLAAVEPPLTRRHLDDMARRLHEVMAKQSHAHARSIEAQEEMRQMLSAFIERLAGMNETSTIFQGQIERSAEKIGQVKRIEELAPLLKEVVSATQVMAEETSRSREQLKSLQEKVLSTEAEIVQLHLELDSASLLARHDPLTDALNRKGLDEAMAREISAMQRRGTPLSVCLLDIDNFKKLNDRLGHSVGDNALTHLVNVARQCMRPTDTLARYGGEEFVILMPETTCAQGIDVITRLQRELTRAFFLAGKEKVLITFSAGVAELRPEESGDDALRRADQAMYRAKKAGKNRVIGV